MMLSLCAVLLLTALGCLSMALITWLVTNRDALAHAWWRRRHPHSVPITIMVADPRQRRNVERALDTALRQLGHAHGLACPAGAIVVQRLVWDGWGGEGIPGVGPPACILNRQP